MRPNTFALILAASLIFLSGCSELDEYYALEGSEVRISDFGETLGLDDSACVNSDEDCVCMVCKGEEYDITNPYHWFYDLPLTGGQCWFEEGCTEEFFRENLEDEENAGFMPFMIGQGSNFAEFSYANSYCNNSARLAVRWLEASEGFDYPLPASERAECFLDKNVIPMYLLHSNGTAEGTAQAARIASEFNGVGPVILSSEFDFDPSDYAAIDLAVEQAFAMKDACPNCLIALSPKLAYNRSLDPREASRGYSATYEAIDYVFATYLQAYSKIDLIGVGLNSHYAPNCVGTSLIYDGIDYSQYVLETYGKPSIWAYVLLDVGGYNSGGAQYGTCTWADSEIIKAYGDIFKYSPALVSNGVIGVAPYSLFGITSGPLECENCGMMSVEGEVYSQHTAWFSLCQGYYNNRGFLFNVFSPSACTDCSFASNFNLYQIDSFHLGTAPSADELEPIGPADTFYRCNGQLITSFPAEIDNHRSRAVNVPSYKCEMYPELDVYSDLVDLDPVLARAYAWMETGLNDDTNGPGGDTCSASQVTSCPNCLTSVSDPEGICNVQTPASPNKYIHSMGIMQVHTYPADQWDEVPGSIQYEEAALRCGGEDFNPFNRENNICLGTQIAIDKLRLGKEFVRDHENQLGLGEYERGSEEYDNMKYAIAIFVSSYYYSGATSVSSRMEGWVEDFGRQREITDTYCDAVSGEDPCCDDDEAKENNCCNNKVFIDYVAECKYSNLPSGTQGKANYGFTLLGRYRGIMDSCEQYDAESWREAIEIYVEEDMRAALPEEGPDEGQ
jgi:hypothetical protein